MTSILVQDKSEFHVYHLKKIFLVSVQVLVLERQNFSAMLNALDIRNQYLRFSIDIGFFYLFFSFPGYEKASASLT